MFCYYLYSAEVQWKWKFKQNNLTDSISGATARCSVQHKLHLHSMCKRCDRATRGHWCSAWFSTTVGSEWNKHNLNIVQIPDTNLAERRPEKYSGFCWISSAGWLNTDRWLRDNGSNIRWAKTDARVCQMWQMTRGYSSISKAPCRTQTLYLYTQPITLHTKCLLSHRFSGLADHFVHGVLGLRCPQDTAFRCYIVHTFITKVFLHHSEVRH